MTEQIKELIDKIQKEGIDAAQEGARQIKKEATEKAAHIIAQAEAEASRMVAAAKEEAENLARNTKAMLVQASRDMLLALRKEINAMLEGLVVTDIRQALTREALVTLITMLIRENCGKEAGAVTLTLKKEDCQALGKGFLERLREETKKGIVLKPSAEVLGGFIISFDEGKSHYDFTDKALAEYLVVYLKPSLKEFLKEAA